MAAGRELLPAGRQHERLGARAPHQLLQCQPRGEALPRVDAGRQPGGQPGGRQQGHHIRRQLEPFSRLPGRVSRVQVCSAVSLPTGTLSCSSEA